MTSIDNYKRTSELLFASAGVQPQSKFVVTDGPVKKVHYYETGNGKPLIIIHGGGAHAVQTYPIIKSLQEKFHLYILDRPGCGLTDTFDYSGVHLPNHATDFVRSFMDAIGIEKASFVGQSMGGFFSINFALIFPQRVEKVLLVGHPFGGARKIPFMLRLMGVKGINSLLIKMIGTPNKKGTKQFYGQLLVADNKKLSDDYLENDVCAALLPGTGVSFVSLLENSVGIGGVKKSYLLTKKMKELTMPVCFIIGDRDSFDTVDNLRKIVATMKNGTIEVVSGGGHILWLDEPEVCSKLILQHLSETNVS